MSRATIAAVYRGDAADPYEQYVWHSAGMGGFGGSSYIDALVLRDCDADLDENAVLEERLYYCQSWRADVVAVVESTGTLVEGARYSAYGVPIGVPAGDTNTDLAFDSTDSTNITGWSPPASYDVRYDVNLDGAITSADASAAATVTLGRGVLSSAACSAASASCMLASGLTGSLCGPICVGICASICAGAYFFCVYAITETWLQDVANCNAAWAACCSCITQL